jgi:hypothetical protein
MKRDVRHNARKTCLEARKWMASKNQAIAISCRVDKDKIRFTGPYEEQSNRVRTGLFLRA